jgi:nicotinamide-nucleotide amidase
MSDHDETLLPAELVDLARRVVDENRDAGRKVAVAESCTGGLVSASLTEIAGSSEVFETGFVTYSNEAKMALLGVSDEVIETFGSVSVAAAWAMAQGALKRSGADVAVAITGIAGPGGGSADKPVGLVWFGLAMAGREPIAERRQFDDRGRAFIRQESVRTALEMALAALR